MRGPSSSAHPVLYWDADCDFCRRWVDRWRQSTGELVEYRPLQEAPPEVIRAAGGPPFERIVLRQPDGSLLAGARAAFAALTVNSRGARLVLCCLERVTWLSRTVEAAYHLVASHRVFFGAITNLLWGRDTRTPTYEISGWLFPRLVGCVFLAAFLSLWVQIAGLAGSDGILPVAGQLDAVRNHFAASGRMHEAWMAIPSLLWFGASDPMIHFWLGVGVAASLLLISGVLAAPAALIAWACYLSFVSAVPVFLSFQWDALLLETGLLVALYVPWQARLRAGTSAPSRIGRLLVWWLLFRLMFESGIVKLHGFDASGRNAWLDGTALDFHFFTQPIPAWPARWLAQAPAWFHWISLILVFVIELVLPFFIAGPRRLRMTAFWGFALLMIAIMASGNYGFFNLLTLALCVTLVDDAVWPHALRSLANATAGTRPPRVAGARRYVLAIAGALLVVATSAQLLGVLRRTQPPLGSALNWMTPLRSANSYGLFSVMTTERPEISIETSADGQNWQPLRFRHKISPEKNSMPFFIPHMPRLDWQMWFAALAFRDTGRLPGWFVPFLVRVRDGSSDVMDLLANDPSSVAKPEYFRIRLDLLNFTDPSERRSSGRVWNSQPLPNYTIEGRLSR